MANSCERIQFPMFQHIINYSAIKMSSTLFLNLLYKFFHMVSFNLLNLRKCDIKSKNDFFNNIFKDFMYICNS